jgi:hypothetical protein
MAKGHYLEKDRLANVIAAIQAMGVADRPSGTLNRWVAELEAGEERTSEQLEQSPIKFAERKKWQTVFEQHPEFFKSYTLRGEPRVLLRWRYAESLKSEANGAANGKHSQNHSQGKDKKDKDEEEGEDEAGRNEAGRNTEPPGKPLSPDQIQVLINTAIEMHAKELAGEQNPDKFRPLLMAVVGAALGTVAGGVIILLIGLLQSGPAHRLFD